MAKETAPVKKLHRNKGKQYSHQQRMEILEMVATCGNISHVCRECGVSRNSIVKWADQLGYPLNRVDVVEVAKDVKKASAVYKKEFLGNLYKVRKEALDKISTLIGTSSSLRDVAYAFDALNKIDDDGNTPDNQGGMTNFIQNIYTQINNSHEEGKPNN